jgi:hypothetical protein
MSHLNPQLAADLHRLNNRSLKRGELFLLAKGISDNILLPPAGETNVRLYTLGHRTFIDTVIYEMKVFVYISTDDVQSIYKIIDDSINWRMMVAYSPASFIFSADPTRIFEDMSGMARFFDLSDVVTVGDIALDANYFRKLFAGVIEYSLAGVNSTDSAPVRGQ